MNDVPPKNNKPVTSIAGLSAEHFVAKDDSLASLLLNRGIHVRDFIVLSFLSDQGPMSTSQLARVVGIEPEKVLLSSKRLSAAGLVLRGQIRPDSETELMVALTGRGQDIARKVSEQLP